MLTRFFKQEVGFTLVELLVTIAILSLLFGIITLALSDVGANAQSEVCTSEYHVVQSAIDIYMAENPGITLSAGTNTTISNGDGQFADFLRGTTVGLYSWTTAGVLTAGTCPAPVSTPPGPCGIPGY
ncbi:MAG: prepilin-type N-terminal cleavage/methylation domain-containing protein [Anaerolineales bacterium]|nr:prepilin-type N-terminal cleavage/methylation domain-containing protein [Anaerolineales bacterium]